jgi:hypothetical protein
LLKAPDVVEKIVIQAVFKFAARIISEGEACDIASITPREMYDLWDWP